MNECAPSSKASLSQRIADTVLTADPGTVSDATWQYLKCCVADALGIAFASHRFDFAEKTLSGVMQLADTGDCVVIGSERRVSGRDAALANGVLIHGLDFDDTHLGSVIHCSASALPTALALANKVNLTGKDLLFSVLLATEIDARIGSAAGGTFQRLGFHPTGLVGIFGAVVAATRLLGGNQRQLVDAQGLALSMAGGSMAFLDEGAWTKRLHPGWSASSALTAAQLALSGFTAPSDAYGGRYGLFSLFTRDASAVDKVEWQDTITQWALEDVAIKPYPVCHFNHAAIDSALMMRERGITVDEIASVEVLLHEGQFGVVVDPIDRKRIPQSEYDAKFSAPYAVAAALVLGRFGLAELESASRENPDILALAAKTSCSHDVRSQFPQAFSGGVRVTMTNGDIHEHFEPVNRGAAGRLLDAATVRQKFMGNCEGSIDNETAEALWTAIMQLDSSDNCTDLLNLLATPVASRGRGHGALSAVAVGAR